MTLNTGNPIATIEIQAPPQPEHWSDTARLWEQLGPPLRPSREDTEFVQSAIDAWAVGKRAPRALILGVTPELYKLRWPAGADVLAMDHTQAMIDCVLPRPARSSHQCGLESNAARGWLA